MSAPPAGTALSVSRLTPLSRSSIPIRGGSRSTACKRDMVQDIDDRAARQFVVRGKPIQIDVFIQFEGLAAEHVVP